MRHWEIGADIEQRTASYCLEEAPWWVFGMERFVDWLCIRVPAIPLASVRNDELNGTPSSTPNTRAWFHNRVHAPLAEWLESRKQQFWLPADYDTIKQRHPAERRMLEELETDWLDERVA